MSDIPLSKSRKGSCFLIILLIALFLSAIYNFPIFCFYFVLVANLIFAINFSFKILLFITYFKTDSIVKNFELKRNLPIYTILLPCYKEKFETLKNLVKNISEINYPKEKLDVKFLIEEDDLNTQANLSKINHNFDILIVPPLPPKTKPNACNYGLYKAKGEFIVVYDAEDKPNKNQLLEALSEFEKYGESIGSVQFLLNFYNSKINLLSKCFSLEYLAWFNAFLPVVQKLGLLIPLGGTSNHFKTKTLIKIGGWDAYNVTEDAELGVRLASKDLKTIIVKSYTLEEAPFKVKTWIFQRQRWMKGYLQTFLSHIFYPKNLKHSVGLFLLVGFSFFSFFLLPFIIIFTYFLKEMVFSLYPLFFFNFACILLYIIMFILIAKKEKFDKTQGAEKWMPFYFLLHSVASLLAFWQFFTKPFYWNKTEHSVKID